MKFIQVLPISILLLSSISDTVAQERMPQRKWVASWTTAIAEAYAGTPLQSLDDSLFYNVHMHPESDLGVPDARALDQTFRMIVKPDLWGDAVRVRFSNVFGDRDLHIAAAAIALQESAAQLIAGTTVPITFDGGAGVTIPKGGQVFSDPVRLPYVTPATKPWLRGRNLAISFALSGKSGSLSSHGAPAYSYFSRPGSGNLVQEDDDEKFPFVTKTYFLVSALDVMANADTAVICAFGDSITDGGTTVNGYDGWSDVLSRKLHKMYGDKVSVVNMAIGGSTVVADLGGPEPAVKRLDRDILGVSGLTTVIWLHGINDLGAGQVRPNQITESMRQVVSRLHDRGITVIGATLTSSLGPRSAAEKISRSWRRMFTPYHDSRVNDNRERLNEFILNSGVFDGVADMASVTQSPQTGALYEEMHIGDYLHPNRVGHQAMAKAVDLGSLMRVTRKNEQRE